MACPAEKCGLTISVLQDHSALLKQASGESLILISRLPRLRHICGFSTTI